jgi:type I restriction enzyme S subunit
VRFPPYLKYKPSGVEWLDKIPENWEVKRLKYSATINDDALPETTDPSYELRYVDISSVDAMQGIVAEEEMVFEAAPSRARRVVRDGDTIVSTVRTYLRAIAPIRKPTDNLIVSTGFAVVRPRSVNPAFLSYTLRESSFVETVVARSVGVSYPAVNASEVGTIPFPLPSHFEQQRIADLLDAETAKLDTLVEKKRELIEKLKEQRSALISRTVTHGLPPEAANAAGLNPNPKLKPSGIEWLGEIPEHWDVKQLKWAIMFQRGHDLPSDDRQEGSVPLVTSSGVSATHAMAAAKGPGIVTGRYGTIGEFYLVEEDYWPLNTTLYSIDLRGNEPRFLYYMLTHLAPLFLLNAVKSAVPGVDRNDIHPIKAAVPSHVEQRAIADYLDRETNKIDRMVAKVEEAIERLQEYRTALITAAVTGKIDVRNVRHSGESLPRT